MTSQEVVRPSDIGELKTDLIQAVTNAYMAKRAPELCGLTFDHGQCKEGEFRFKSPAADGPLGFTLDSDTGYYCSYPGGVWKEDELMARDSGQSPGPATYGTGDLFDAKATFAMIESEVSSWIDPWANDCHSPNEFANQINSIANIANQLYIGDQVVFGGQEVAPVQGDNSASSGMSAVTDVRSAIDEIKLGTDDLQGLAIDAFQRTYVLDIERTIGGQRGLATAAGLAITAEAVVWNETFISLRDFIKKATYDFNDFAGSHGAAGEDTVATLGAVSAIAGLAGGTVGVSFPPFGVAMGVVGGVATVGSLMFHTESAVKSSPLVLSGGSYLGYWTSFKDHIKDINTDLESAENAIGEGCRRMVNDYTTFPDNYSISRTTGSGGGQGPKDSLKPLLTSEIDFNHTKMRRIAGAVESIGDHQRSLAGRLGGVDGSGNPSTSVNSEWTRGSLPEVGTMGNGYYGPYADFGTVINELIDLFILEQRTAHRVAEHCIDVSLSFRATDDARRNSLDRLAKQFDTVDIPVVN